MQPPIRSGVLLNELLRCIDRVGHTFDCLLNYASRNALHPLGD